MAQTPEEVKAKKVARKQAQIDGKIAKISFYEAKKMEANSVRLANMARSDNATDAKLKAKFDKLVAMLEKRIVRLQASINRLEEKRLQYAQELAVLLGGF